jgi:hypothetical protein
MPRSFSASLTFGLESGHGYWIVNVTSSGLRVENCVVLVTALQDQRS